MLKRLLSIAVLLPTAALAQAAVPAVAGAGINWLGSFSLAVDALVTSTAGTLLGIGQIELAFVAAIGLIMMAIRWQVSVMNLWHHAHSFHMGELVIYLFKVVAAEAMLASYSSFHRLFPLLATALTQGIDLQIVKTFIEQMQVFSISLQLPGVLNVPGALIILGTMLQIGFIQVALFVLNAFSFVAIGMLTFFGPLLIPLLVTKRFEAKFWAWIDNLIVYSSYRVFAAGFSFVFANVFMGFFNKALRGDYSIGNLIALFPVLIMLTISFLWAMFKIPTLATMIFGGSGALGESFSNDMKSAILAMVG